MSPKEVAFIPYHCVIMYLFGGRGSVHPSLPFCTVHLLAIQVSYLNVQFETKYLSNLINHLHSHNWLAEVDGWMIANQLEQFLDPGFISWGT